MNKILSYAQKAKYQIAVVMASFVAVAPFASHALLADDITDIVESVTVTFQSGATTVLTTVLPAVVIITLLFLAARKALAWMKRSAK